MAKLTNLIEIHLRKLQVKTMRKTLQILQRIKSMMKQIYRNYSQFQGRMRNPK